jgi:hypothetical protein
VLVNAWLVPPVHTPAPKWVRLNAWTVHRTAYSGMRKALNWTPELETVWKCCFWNVHFATRAAIMIKLGRMKCAGHVACMGLIKTAHTLSVKDRQRTPKLKMWLTLSLLMSYIYGAPCKARNFNVVYIYGPTFGNAEIRLFLFAAQCFNTESMQKVILWHICV